ncbi:DNA-directed RNA polymerase III complex subunit Rpc25 [Ceratocystis pirilliformis]|uniref:DNA-directed RNA polymerase subunit n=1 Tax=Ceratocystis pirilliformis TaxID=259994 RepID=A0ABR3ZP84_9PEZI
MICRENESGRLDRETKVADLVQIAPDDFSKRSRDAIEDNINAKYANRVIQSIGLCICLYDLLWASEGLIGHGDGLVNVNVEFRIIVFRPFRGEVMLGRIRSSTPQGVYFQSSVLTNQTKHSNSDHQNQNWVWSYEDPDSGSVENLIMDNNEMVRFQVIDEEWHDQTPDGPSQVDDPNLRKAPYKINGSMAKEGLGICYWWD